MFSNRNDELKWLRLLQIADSALPIGATAHSFGMETLVEDGTLTVPTLFLYLRDYLLETGTLEVGYCLAAAELLPDSDDVIANWLRLNMRLDALKTARESRVGSATLGRRFLRLASDLENHLLLGQALQAAKQEAVGVHHCTAFGLAGAVLGLPPRQTVLAYLNQSIAGLVSACQRLLPLGQTSASQIQWALKPVMIEVLNQTGDVTGLSSFTALVDVASQRHPTLTTRLFIS
jgi:urease accessory protein